MFLKNLLPFNQTFALLSVLAAAFSMGLANAAVIPGTKSVTLGWNAVPQTDIQGYRVSVGTQSGQYTQTLNTGTATSMPVDNLEVGQTYYFTVVAIGSTGLESPPSTELRLTIAPPPLPLGSSVAASGAGVLKLQWTFPSSAMDSSPEFIVQASSDLRIWTQVATVLAKDSVGGNAQSTQFSWDIPQTDSQMFYRLTAKNWLGTSTTP